MSTIEILLGLFLVIALACKGYAILKPNEGLHNWAWGFLWLAVFVLAFGARAVR